MKQLLSSPGLRLALLLVFFIVALPTGGARAAQATGFLTFESGRDGAAITLPGISLTTGADVPWRYGDVRTRQYNAPHPQSCADRPVNVATPTCQYAVGENFFAWTGTLGDPGRVTFTQGDASFVAFDLAVGARTTVIAYSLADRPLAAVAVQPNANGNSNAVQLNAPLGEGIAYVVISGTTNFWLLDNLATDAPGVPDQRPLDTTLPPAQVTVIQRVALPAVVAPGSEVTLTLVVVNRGRGPATQTFITLPFDPSRVRVLEASFSRPGAWVSRLDSDQLEIQSGFVASQNDTLTITVRFAILADAPDGGVFGQQLSFRWQDSGRGGEGRSNTLGLAVGTTVNAAAALAISPAAAPAGTPRVVTSPSFAPREPVALWYHAPDGRVVELGLFRADEQAMLEVTLADFADQTGRYTLVAYGHWTEFTVVTSFSVP